MIDHNSSFIVLLYYKYSSFSWKMMQSRLPCACDRQVILMSQSKIIPLRILYLKWKHFNKKLWLMKSKNQLKAKNFLSDLKAMKRSISRGEITLPKSFHWLVNFSSFLNYIHHMVYFDQNIILSSSQFYIIIYKFNKQFNPKWKLGIRSTNNI